MTTGKALNGKPYAGNPHVRLLMVFAAICVAATTWADVTAPGFVSNEALFWFDASVLTETAGTELDSWADVRGGSHPSVTTYTTTKPKVIEFADGALAGKKAVSFGTIGDLCDMKFAKVQEIKTAFFVVDLDQKRNAFLLGGPEDGEAPRNYGFHRGEGGSYRYEHLNTQYCNDGKTVTDPDKAIIPTGYQLISWKWSANSAQVLYMGSDREIEGRVGGKRLCEVVAFSRELDIAECSRVEGYLKEKWFGGTAGINGATEMLGKKGQVHFDASVASSFHYEGDETGTKVSKWDDLSGNNNNFSPCDAKSGNVNATRYGTRGEVAGKPVFDSGAASSGIDLALSTRITNTRSVIMVAEVDRSGSVFWLGDSTEYRFHRGKSDQFARADNENMYIGKYGKIWQNGQRIMSPTEEYAEPPGGLSVYTLVTSQKCEWNKLGQDRDINGRNGGKRVAELITFSSELTEADCEGVYRLMKEKWSPSDAYVDSLIADAPVHVDASSADNFNYTDGTITGWKNSGKGSDLVKPTTLYDNNTAMTCNPGSYGFTNGVPAFLMGPHGSYIDLCFSRISNVRTVFWVMDIVRDKDSFFLGDGKNDVITSESEYQYHFHRGYQSDLVGCYASSDHANAGWYTGPLYCDGSVVASMASERPLRGAHVYDVTSYQDLTASSISADRESGSRNGGRAISELLILTTPVSGLTRGMIRERIEAKWTRSCGWAGAGDAEWGAGKYRVFDADAAVPAEGAMADGVGFKASAALSGGTLTLGDGGIFASEGAAVTVSAPVAGKLGVYGPGTVALTAAPAAVDSISVGYGATLTLAAGTTAVSGGLSIQENGKLVLDVSALAERAHASITFSSLSLPAGGSLYDYVSLVGWEERGHALAVMENAIHVNPPDVAAVAVWTAAQNTNVENPANWSCRNFNGEPVANVIPEVSTTSVTFNADCDLRALGRVAFADGVVFDLNGHAVKIAGLAAQGYPLASVTNSDANATAELRIDVANGLTITNATVVLGGKMNFVKDGAGTFVAAKARQTYVGVNEVANGVLEIAYDFRDSRDYPFGAEGNSFLVRTGATFKMNAMYAQANAVYKFVLDGGRLLGSYEDVEEYSGQIHLIELTKDSTFEPTTSCGLVPRGDFNSPELDLGGHTLTVPIGTGKTFYLYNAMVKNGMVDITSGGWLQTKSGYTVTAMNADFRVGSAMKISGPISVRDYEQVYGVDYNDGTAAFNVHGTFKPAAGHNYFYGCTMQNGSTIDLSSRADALPLVSSFTKGDNTLKFAAGTIHVKLGERSISRKTCLISWSSKPSGIASTRFVNAEGERSRRFFAQDDGLYISGGTMVVVR